MDLGNDPPDDVSVKIEITAQRDSYSAGRDQMIYNIIGSSTESVAPELLPRDTPSFTGRQRELAQIIELASSNKTIVVSAIDGVAGAGKTALAVHAAHKLLPQFSDGQLYADFRGYTQSHEPLAPGVVLEQFLRHLGIPAEEVPTELDERSAMFRAILSRKRTLVVLDNVSTESQVIPLLPGVGSSFVLLTSRSMLPGLELDYRLPLDVMSRAEAIELLTTLIGSARTHAELEAVVQIADLCGNLPLALRISGQLLAVHPQWPASKLATMLKDERTRLSRLAVGDQQVRAAFLVSYGQLAESEALVFRALGLHPGPISGIPAIACLADMREDYAAEQLERLALVNLVIEDDASRFRMHDLLRLFARERCEDDGEESFCREAIARVMNYYFRLATYLDCATDPRCRPMLIRAGNDASAPIPSPAEALEIFDMERANFLAAVNQAVSDGRPEKAWELCRRIDGPLVILRHLDELISVNQIALDAARNLSLRSAEAEGLGNLGMAYLSARRFDDSEDRLKAALKIFEELGDRRSVAITFGHLGTVNAQTRRFDQALSYFHRATKTYGEIGDRHGSATMNVNIGNVYSEQRKFQEAVDCFSAGISIFKEEGDYEAEAAASNGIGISYGQAGQYEMAVPWLEKAAELQHTTGNLFGQAMSLSNLGNVHQFLEDLEKAVESYTAALTIFRQTGDRHEEAEALNNLGITETELGLYDRAIADHQAALTIHGEIGDLHSRAISLNNLGRVYFLLGHLDEAAQCLEDALELYRETSDEHRFEETLNNLLLVRNSGRP